MIRQESWRVDLAEEPSYSKLIEIEALMTEMLAENERLRKLVSQRGARMQILWENMRLTDKEHFIQYDHPDARGWFDVNGVPK